MNDGNMATCLTFSQGRASVCHSLVVDNFIGKEERNCKRMENKENPKEWRIKNY